MEKSQSKTPETKCGTTPKDGTLALLKQHGIPLTRENYLNLAFNGKPPAEPLDGEIEAMLPSAGMSDEPSYTTPAGFPICSRCGRSTRNMERLVCRPCETGARLPLTAADRKWLRQIGIARGRKQKILPKIALRQSLTNCTGEKP
jgi:hypothetical protein